MIDKIMRKCEDLARRFIKNFISPSSLDDESRAKALAALDSRKRLDIITLPHTQYVAKLLQRQLQEIGFECEIYDNVPLKKRKELFIVICPQVFEMLPEKYIAFQMEQTVSSRWLSDEYYKILENAVAVFDYSKRNMEFFKDSAFASRLYYVPIDYCDLSGTEMKPKHDVLFYGDTRCERRKMFLERLQEHFDVKILFKVYQDAALEEIKQAKVVVNIHYYEDALLETTRVNEVLSLGSSIIVSEKGIDNDEYRLDGIVDFVEIGDVDAMISRVAYWLEDEARRREKLVENKAALLPRENSTAIALRRFFNEAGKTVG